MRKLIVVAATFALFAGSTPSLAAPCRGAHGKFAKCPPAATKAVRCRNAKGQFAKCGLSGTHPA